MINNIFKNIIGSGATFPIQLSTNSKGERGWYPEEGTVKLIEDNLKALVTYEIGQRIRQEEFGTRIWECIEEPNTQVLTYLINHFLKEAFEAYEDRITYTQSSFEIIGSKIKIYYNFKVNMTGIELGSEISIER